MWVELWIKSLIIIENWLGKCWKTIYLWMAALESVKCDSVYASNKFKY